jgi:hypothetical protein
MPGPDTAEKALRCAKDAITHGRFVPAVHFGQRLGERAVDMADVHTAIDKSHQAEPYDGEPRSDGTCWRIIGPDCDDERDIGVGVEIYANVDRTVWMTLCTVIIMERN